MRHRLIQLPAVARNWLRPVRLQASIKSPFTRAQVIRAAIHYFLDLHWRDQEQLVLPILTRQAIAQREAGTALEVPADFLV